jgi:hypothetical protein
MNIPLDQYFGARYVRKTREEDIKSFVSVEWEGSLPRPLPRQASTQIQGEKATTLLS